VVIESAPMVRRRVGVSFAYPIHDIGPLMRDLAVDDGTFERAGQLARSDYHGQEPFFLFYELMHRAGSASLARRFSEEITDLGTAMEVLISTVLREAGPLIGRSAHQIANVLDAPLRNQVEHHLGGYASIDVDLGDAANPAGGWWQDGYALRNRVVHEGHKPTEQEVATARQAAVGFVNAIRDGLRSMPTTQRLGSALQWGRLEPEEDQAI
jgi:hypothetical protein